MKATRAQITAAAEAIKKCGLTYPHNPFGLADAALTAAQKEAEAEYKKGFSTMKPTGAQIDAAANAMFAGAQLVGRKLTRGDCRVMARLALEAVQITTEEHKGGAVGAVTPAADL